jgi:ribosomal-protein-alanine N-acetyltransferase
MTDLTLRQPLIDDLTQVNDIEINCFPIPWNKEIFIRIIRCKGRYQVDEDDFILMVVLARQSFVVGYAIWEESLYEEHGHILNLAVREDNRCKGNGSLLLNHALKCMRDAGMKTCELEVRESNQNARNLYSKAGMMAVDRVEEYYDVEDAIIYAIEF